MKPGDLVQVLNPSYLARVPFVPYVDTSTRSGAEYLTEGDCVLIIAAAKKPTMYGAARYVVFHSVLGVGWVWEDDVREIT